MSDLLGSILDNMTAPPINKDKDAIKRKHALKRKRDEEARRRAAAVREVQKKVDEFVSGKEVEFSFKPSEKEWRAIQHEMAEVTGLISVSCNNGPTKEKYVTIFKKENCPSEEEMKKRRLGENYIEGYTKHVPAPSRSKPCNQPIIPTRNYQDKYKKFIDTLEVKEDSRQFHGLVPVHMLCSEQKTIEDSLNEIRDKKRVKTDSTPTPSTSSDKNLPENPT